MTHDNEPKKLVIIAGPTLGTVVGLLGIGAALGAAGVVYLQRTRNTAHSRNSFADDLMGVDAEHDSAMVDRANNLMRRVKVLSARARDTVQIAGEALAPRIQSAISEAKYVAAETEHELQKELDVD